MRRFPLALLLSAGLSSVLPAQTVTVGALPPSPNFAFSLDGALTVVDLAHPAPVAATLTSAAFNWSTAPCPAAVKLKFFRASPNGSFLLLAERGPYNVTSLLLFVPLSPPVDVQAGDLIGIARISSCGSPVGQSPGAAAGVIRFPSDVTSDVPGSSGSVSPNVTLSVQASGTATLPPTSPDPAAVVPVVGSTPGALGGSFFRTSVQLHNP
ncbi:MAG TPA: hypothetical protein VFF17_11000, partial [Thermoanaerobaculia bacterium]|nr:hypothetical protein [Thermoanaerobaculia bacterium]